MPFYSDGSWTYRSGDAPTLERWDGGEWVSTRMTLEAMQAAAIGGEIWAEINPGAVDLRVEKHWGPGPHPGTGTSQDVHGGEVASLTEEIGLSRRNLRRKDQLFLAKEIREHGVPRRLYRGTRQGTTADVPPLRVGDEVKWEEPVLSTTGTIWAAAGFTRKRPDAGMKTLIRFDDDLAVFIGDYVSSPGEDEWLIEGGSWRIVNEVFEDSTQTLRFNLPGPWSSTNVIYRVLVAERIGVSVRKHYGPGPHPGTGTSQKVHAGLVNPLKGKRQVKGEKVASFLVHADGSPMSMRLDGLPPEIQEKIFKSAAEGYNLTTDMDLIRARYETILAAAEERYKANPDLRDDDRFYERWFEIWESEGKGRFALEQVVATAAVTSPGLEAEVSAEARSRGVEDNVTMTRRMMDMVHENPELNVFQAAVVNDMVGALHAKYSASSRNKAVAEFYDFEVAANTKFLDLPNGYVQAQAMHMLMRAEDGSGVPAQRGWRNWAVGFDVLTGRADPSQVLTSPKVRSFYNNIMDPTDTQGRGDVTVDFHMIDSAFWATGSDDLSGPASSPEYKGVALGIRPMVGQAVHQLLPEWGARVGAESPAQLQEVIWAEWKRGKEDGSWGELETLARK